MQTTRWGRGQALACLGLTLATLFAAGAARAQETATTEAMITLDLRDVPFRTAIEALFEKTGLQYAVEPGVPNIPVRVTVRDIDFTTALRTITRLGGATYRKEGPIYMVGLRQPPQPQELTSEIAPEVAPADQLADQTWEKIPILFNSYAVMAYAFGGQVLPTEDQFVNGGGGGGGFGGGQGGFGGGQGGLGGGGFGGGQGGL